MHSCNIVFAFSILFWDLVVPAISNCLLIFTVKFLVTGSSLVVALTSGLEVSLSSYTRSAISNLTFIRLLSPSNRSIKSFLNSGEVVNASYSLLNFLSSSVTSFIDDLSILNGDLKEDSRSIFNDGLRMVSVNISVANAISLGLSFKNFIAK